MPCVPLCVYLRAGRIEASCTARLANSFPTGRAVCLNSRADERCEFPFEGFGLFGGATMHALWVVSADVPDVRRDEVGTKQSARANFVDARDRGWAVGDDQGICGRNVFLFGLPGVHDGVSGGGELRGVV